MGKKKVVVEKETKILGTLTGRVETASGGTLEVVRRRDGTIGVIVDGKYLITYTTLRQQLAEAKTNDK